MATAQRPAVNETWKVKDLTVPQPTEKTAPNNGAVNSSEGVERQIRAMQQEISSLNDTVSRLSRVSRVNLNESRLSEHQTTQALLQSAFVLTSQLQQMMDHKEVDPMAMSLEQMQRLHLQARERREDEVSQHLDYIERMSKAKQELTPLCPCGKHKGIRFTEGEFVLEENVCPMAWWFKQSRLAFKNHCLTDFTANYPLSDYLFAYTT